MTRYSTTLNCQSRKTYPTWTCRYCFSSIATTRGGRRRSGGGTRTSVRRTLGCAQSTTTSRLYNGHTGGYSQATYGTRSSCATRAWTCTNSYTGNRTRTSSTCFSGRRRSMRYTTSTSRTSQNSRRRSQSTGRRSSSLNGNGRQTSYSDSRTTTCSETHVTWSSRRSSTSTSSSRTSHSTCSGNKYNGC